MKRQGARTPTRPLRGDLVIEGGRIVEEGSHAALVARGGTYARMFAMQAEWYA